MLRFSIVGEAARADADVESRERSSPKPAGRISTKRIIARLLAERISAQERALGAFELAKLADMRAQTAHARATHKDEELQHERARVEEQREHVRCIEAELAREHERAEAEHARADRAEADRAYEHARAEAERERAGRAEVECAREHERAESARARAEAERRRAERLEAQLRALRA